MYTCRVRAPALLLLFLGTACAQYSQLWLNFTRVAPNFIASLGVSTLGCSLPGPLCGELRAGLTGLLGALPGGGGRAVTVALPAGAPTQPAWPPSPALEGYSIRVGADGISLQAASLQGALYGAWRLLALVQAEAPSLLSPGVAEASAPKAGLRVWQLWDNLNGSVERGYSGRSILYPLGSSDPARVTDFARLLSSMGINAIVLDNVNACGSGNERVLGTPSLQLLAPIAGAFYSYGIHSLLVPCWTSPQTVGGLNTSDPRVPEVAAWWAAKIGEASATFPAGAFRGLLFKGDTEGEPGPNMYNLTELWGANFFGALLAPASAIAVWRAFSHPPNGRTMPVDQALFQFQRFAGWDGNTLPNVVLQTKNGPYDFQVREPVHSLFGALPRVNVVLELEATPEYLGQEVHAVALPLQWGAYLAFDLCGAGGGDTTLGGVVARGAFSGMAAVSNFGAGGSWTGHPLNAANAFGFGRLAWAPATPPLAVVKEWAAITFPGSAPASLDGRKFSNPPTRAPQNLTSLSPPPPGPQKWWACWATRGRLTKTSPRRSAGALPARRITTIWTPRRGRTTSTRQRRAWATTVALAATRPRTMALRGRPSPRWARARRSCCFPFLTSNIPTFCGARATAAAACCSGSTRATRRARTRARALWTAGRRCRGASPRTPPNLTRWRRCWRGRQRTRQPLPPRSLGFSQT